MRGTGIVRPGAIASYGQRDSIERIVIGKRGWLETTVAKFKAMVSISFTRTATWTFGDRGTRSMGGTIDYRERAGDGRNNAIVLSALDLLATTFAQSPLVVKKIDGDSENIVPNHELVRRLIKPNDFYSGKLLWKATIIDYAFGNAYWLKVRSGADKPVQFYWIPSTIIEPAWPQDNPKVFISHYEYNPNGKKIDVDIRNVVHFRNGMDPHNIRKGLSPLAALLREIATDEEAAEYTNTILRQLGVAGMVISPATDKGKISQADADKIKLSIMSRTTGDRRGEPLVVGGAVKVDQMGVDPGKLDLAAIRHVPEERITSMFGTPAVLLGLGTGLENATFSNVDGLRRIFYENKVIPLQGFIASDIHTQLLDDYEGNSDVFTVDFDNKKVRVLKEDENEIVDRLLKEMEGGGLTRDEYRAERNRQPAPGSDVYMLSSRIIPVAVDKLLEPKVTAANEVPNDGTAPDNNDNADSSDSAVPNAGGANNENGAKFRTKDIGDSLDRIYSRMQIQCKSDVQGYLDAQKYFVLAQIENKGKSSSKVRISWPRVQEDYEALRGVLEPWYKRVLVAVHDVVQDVLDTRYEISGSDERTYLKATALNIKGINDYTRSQVAAAVALSTELDETVEELTDRIRALGVFSEARAVLIARTELVTATTLAQIESYKSSEVVVGVHITDGDQDAVCKAVDGLRLKMSEARSVPPLGHPNCIRKFWHILDVKELEGAA